MNIWQSEKPLGSNIVNTVINDDSVVPSSGAIVDYVSDMGGGDITKAVYDPTGIEDDAFDMGNMYEAATNKIFTATERTKLAGIEASANNYVHPVNHTPDIITQDADNRFVTDAQITIWTAKQDALVSGTNIKTINSTSLLGSTNIAIDHNTIANKDIAGNHAKIIPTVDSTNAFSIYKADGITTMMKFDTTNDSSIIYSTNNERFIVDSTGISCYGDFTIGDGNTQTVAIFPADVTTGSIVIGDVETYGHNTNITIDDANSQIIIKNKLNLNGGIIKPNANSTTAIQITKADGSTAILNVDSTNSRIGIGNSTPSETLEVSGNIKITGNMLKITGITTTERDELTAVAGDIIYNITINKHQGYDGSNWNDLY